MISIIFVLLGIYAIHFVYEYIKRKPLLDNISKKCIVITGCDTGFGNALAKKLDSLGCHVFAACYTQKGVDDLRMDSSSRLKPFLLDVSKEKSVKDAFGFVSMELPAGAGLWGLVNNAGVQSGVHSGSIPLEYSARQDFQEVLDVNLLGMIDMTLTFLPLLKQTKGRVVNMCSIAGRMSLPLAVPYSVSKFGVQAFSDALRMNVHQYGIKVSILEPGFFATSICSPETVRVQCEKGYARLTEEQKKSVSPEYVQKSVEFTLAATRRAPTKLDAVVDAYTHGLFAVNPKKRYCCGWDTYLIVQPLSYAPSWLQDTFGLYVLSKFRKIYNVNSVD